MDIIQYLLLVIQQQYQMLCWLILFICRYIPLKQWAYDEAHSPEYQKYTTDKLPVIKTINKQDYLFLLEYYLWKYGKKINPVQRRNGRTIPDDTFCPICDATHHYIYDNNGGNGQYQCKVCGQTFSDSELHRKTMQFTCPYCGRALVMVKKRKFFYKHKCVNLKCPFYVNNLKKVKPKHLEEDYGKNRYKLHYIYREYIVDFFSMKRESLPKYGSVMKFVKYNSHIMGLCLTYHVNLKLSLRDTAQALKDLYGIEISHQQVANYAKGAAAVIKPFVDHYDYKKSSTYVADETYISVRKIRGYVWFIMDAVSRSIIGYQVSDNRGVGPCIQAMIGAFHGLKELPDNFRFIADGYSVYPLAALQFAEKFRDTFRFVITPVIGLTNDDAVTKEFRPYKQLIERLNRTYKSTYRISCGYDNFEGANYNVALWVAYYNFLRPHYHNDKKVLNHVDMLHNTDNMPGKWVMLIYLGQQTILNLEESDGLVAICY